MTSDEIGNILNDGTWSYTWAQGRQLATMAKSGTTWTFTYDASGMRTQRSNGSTTYNYTYHGSQLTHMTYGSNSLHFYYDASGKPLSVVYNGTTYYYILSLQGDVVAILDSTGSPVVEYTYDAWGRLLSTTGSMSGTLGLHNPLRYRSYVYDQETGLYYLQSRYYNSAICRFISADSISYLGADGTPQSYNLFAYCGNNPVLIQYSSYSGAISGNSTSIQGADVSKSINTTSNPLVFSIGLLTQKSKNIPSWMSINAFYMEATLLQDLSLISLSTGVLDATFHTPKWFSSLPDDHLANPNIYFGVGTWNANASIGIGASGSAEILSGTVGMRLGDAFSVGIKGYVGFGIAIDFSKGIKLGLGLGLGVEASIEIDWYLLFN